MSMSTRIWRRVGAVIATVVLGVTGVVVTPAAAGAGTAAAPSEDCMGVSWSIGDRGGEPDTYVLYQGDLHTDTALGDTACSERMPVLCTVPTATPRPRFGMEVTADRPWTRSVLRPLGRFAGTELTSRAAADTFCSNAFGARWRMAEIHQGDGPGLGMWGIGVPQRLWVAVDNQRSNPWDTRTGLAHTWSQREHDIDSDTSDFNIDRISSGTSGDTPITTSTPMLCLMVDGRPEPDGIETNNYNGWSGGEAKVSRPVLGSDLTSRRNADRRCAQQFGTGYRMAEYHDGIQAGFWASGSLGRVWVANDQAPANPWD